jgi:hypothetical protein
MLRCISIWCRTEFEKFYHLREKGEVLTQIRAHGEYMYMYSTCTRIEQLLLRYYRTIDTAVCVCTHAQP